jgi:hypothetical protein
VGKELLTQNKTKGIKMKNKPRHEIKELLQVRINGDQMDRIDEICNMMGYSKSTTTRMLLDYGIKALEGTLEEVAP